MANYLLLRNNKESGPYSVDDLMQLGLKAYDLLWVQGKSAAWRYPSEIEELKPFAPVVEEQPFDRFFKKPDPQISEKIQEAAPIVFTPTPVKEAPPAIDAQYEKYIPKRSVAVTMPSHQQSTPINEPVNEKTSVVAQPTISISENPAAAQIKYSQPLDEIKEMYVKTLYDRKQKIARKSFWLQSMKKAAVILGLVAIGLIAGFIIKPGKNGTALLASKIEKAPPAIAEPVNTKSTADTIVATTPIPATIPSRDLNTSLQTEASQVQHQPNGGYVNKLRDVKPDPFELKQNAPTVKSNNPGNRPKENVDELDTKSTGPGFVPEGAETNAVTGERSRKVRNANSETGNYMPNTTGSSPTTERKASIPGDIAGLVTVKSNEYKRVAFGGIRDLQLTVTNESKYILDDVTVELQYIKPNELPLKTENIQFTSIAPNAASTIRVPDTNRGIKVTFRIVNIKKRGNDERVADN